MTCHCKFINCKLCIAPFKQICWLCCFLFPKGDNYYNVSFFPKGCQSIICEGQDHVLCTNHTPFHRKSMVICNFAHEWELIVWNFKRSTKLNIFIHMCAKYILIDANIMYSKVWRVYTLFSIFLRIQIFSLMFLPLILK